MSVTGKIVLDEVENRQEDRKVWSTIIDEERRGFGHIDVSDHSYTLATLSTFGGSQIHADSDIHKIGEISFRQFNVATIKKVEKAAHKAKCDFEYDSGLAVISAKSIIKANWLNITCDDEGGWKKVETFIECWMKAGKRDINVKLSIIQRQTVLRLIQTMKQKVE